MSDYTKNSAYFSNTEQAIEFNDKNLEAVIKEILKLGSNEKVTTENILKLTTIRAERKEITDLSGLEYAKNLRIITFNQNNISSLEPLKNINNLYSVGFASNPNLKMEELIKLEHITELNLSYNLYTDEEVSQLAKYSDMSVLFLDYCQLNSIDFVSGMKTLVRLQVSNNNLTNIDALDSNNLIGLWATGNRITSLNNVKNISGLQRVWLDANKLTSLDWLAKLNNVTYVYAGANNIEKVVISSHQKLQYLELTNSNVTDIELADLPSLQVLFLNSNLSLSSFSKIANLPNLAELDLSYNEALTYIEGVNAAPNLKKIVLTNCSNITDFSPLSSCRKITYFNCNTTDMGDEQMKKLGFQSELAQLAAAHCNLTHIDFVSHFPALKQVGLAGNHISDISQLSDNVSQYVVTDQTISLADVALGEKTEIQLKGRNSQHVDDIEWLTAGSITVEGDKQNLLWAHSGENKLTFSWQEDAGTTPEFSGMITQTVNK